MAKKKSKRFETAVPALSYRPPSPAEQMRQAAEHTARTTMDVHPKFKKMRDAITREVQKAARKVVGGSARKGGFGG